MTPHRFALVLAAGVITIACGPDPVTPTAQPVVGDAPPPPKPPEPSPLRAVALDAYINSTCVVASDATVWCWGPLFGDASGIPRRVEGISDATDVSVGPRHVCALHRDATVSCAGYGRVAGAKPDWRNREIYRVPHLAGVTAIASITDQSCALVKSGEVRCWGHAPRLSHAPIRSIDLPIAAEKIDAGSHSICVVGEGDLWCFPLNKRGKPTRLGREKYTALAMTERGGVCALMVGGGMRCFGSPCTGKHSPWKHTCEYALASSTKELAAGTFPCAKIGKDWHCWNTLNLAALVPGTKELRKPSVLPHPGEPSDLALGLRHACVLERDGRVTCWGRDAYGALGRGPEQWARRRYVASHKATAATELAIPDTGMCRVDKPLPTCLGEIMLGGSRTRQSRTKFPQAAGARAIYARVDNMCALGSSDLVCWGMLFAEPTTVPIADIREVALGEDFGCAIAGPQRAIHCWGEDSHFNMPSDALFGRGVRAPAAFPDVAHVRVIAAGPQHLCWQHEGSSALMCMGRLGNSASPVRLAEPTSVFDLPDIDELAAGHRFNCALVGDTVKCWGDGREGALGNGAWDIHATPVNTELAGARSVTASRHHVCAVTRDGAVHCWGRNMSGQLGTGDRRARNVPTRVPNVEGARAVVVGQGQTCAILEDGDVLCWGWPASRLFDPDAQIHQELPPGGTLQLGEIPDVKFERITKLRSEPLRE